MKKVKQNLVLIGGAVSFVEIKESTTKPGEFFGSVNIATDDGYYDKKDNNKWVERISFIDVKLSNFVIQQIKSLNVGDDIELQGKLVVEKWVDNDQKNRQSMKVVASKVISHTTKQELELIKTLK